jgi:hypothetical protein
MKGKENMKRGGTAVSASDICCQTAGSMFSLDYLGLSKS